MEIIPSTPEKGGSPQVCVRDRVGKQSMASSKYPLSRFWLIGYTQTLVEAADKLFKTVLTKCNAKYDVKLILGFDEASKMAAMVPERSWNPYTIICQTLRSLHNHPIFSIFLSTTGSVRQFNPTPEVDHSSRVQSGQLTLWPPFTLLGYDQLATPLCEGIKLSDNTDEFMLLLGRSL